jgi:hypothetical protein
LIEMRVPLFARALAALAVAVTLGFFVTSAASADSSEVRFTAAASVVTVGILPTAPPPTAVFETGPGGRITSVTITTVDEVVIATDLRAHCRRGPAADALCAALQGSAVFSLHTSVAELTNPRPIQVQGPTGPLDALFGRIRGDLQGAFLVTPTGIPDDATMSGGAALQIHGIATYACLIGPMAACQAAGTGLFPVSLNVLDTGTFTIDSGLAGGYLVSNGTGRVIVQANLLDPVTGAASGKVAILNASATLTPLPPS